MHDHDSGSDDAVYSLTPASALPLSLLLGIALILVCMFVFLLYQNIQGQSAGYSLMRAIIMVLLGGIIVLFGYHAYSSRHMRLEISKDTILIRNGIYARSVRTESLLLCQARCLDLDLSLEYRPRLRTRGIGLPGYKAGWFRLQDEKKSLVFLTDTREVLYIPTTEGYAVLLSVPLPCDLLDRLKSAVGNRHS